MFGETQRLRSSTACIFFYYFRCLINYSQTMFSDIINSYSSRMTGDRVYKNITKLQISRFYFLDFYSCNRDRESKSFWNAFKFL